MSKNPFSLPDAVGTAPVSELLKVTLVLLLATFMLFIQIAFSFADGADITGVDAQQKPDGTWLFSVTVLHSDAGWDHYADKWALFAPDGTLIAERILAHPHDNEQPFTRSKSGIVIPRDVREVTVKAHDNVHGWSGKKMTYEILELGKD